MAERIRWGTEPDAREWAPQGERCPDCGVEPLELHVDGCDVEHCANCGGQRITCPCGTGCLDG